MLLTQLQRQWPRLVVAVLSLHSLFAIIRHAFGVPTPLPGITPDEHQYFHFIAYAVDILFSLVDLHRLYVAYRPTTGGVQVSFNIWSIGTTFMALINIVGESFDYFVPEFKDLANSATFAAEIFSQQNLSMPMLLPEQATQVTTLPTLFETVWKGVESWTPSVLNIMLGLALWTILNQRWQLDHEQEERLEQQGYHLLGTKSDLPAPIASALTVDGFKTEAEIRRLRLRVPTWPRLIMGLWFLVEVYHGIRGHPRSLLFLSVSLKMSFYILLNLAGLYALYCKSLVLTKWLFYSICATTLRESIVFGTFIWNIDLANLDLFMKTIEVGEKSAINGRKFIRGMMLIIFYVFFAVRLWVAWRLVADLEARDARVARAREQQELRERGPAEKQQPLDDVVTEKTVDH